MTDKPENPPAFPSHAEVAEKNIPFGNDMVAHTPAKTILNDGMTLRDYFAAKALNCWTIDSEDLKKMMAGDFMANDFVAAKCYEIADAMLAARSQK